MTDTLVTLLADLEEDAAIARVRERLAAGDAPGAIIDDCQAGLAVVGERYREGTYYIAGLIMAGEIFRETMEILEPLVGPRTTTAPRSARSSSARWRATSTTWARTCS